MTREEAFVRLRAHEAELKAMGADTMYLFGSVARDEAAAESDVDVAFDVDAQAHPRFSLFDVIGLKHRLEAIMGTKVDLAQRAAMRPRFAARVSADLRQVW